MYHSDRLYGSSWLHGTWSFRAFGAKSRRRPGAPPCGLQILGLPNGCIVWFHASLRCNFLGRLKGKKQHRTFSIRTKKCWVVLFLDLLSPWSFDFLYSGVRSDQDDSNMFKSSLVVLAAPSHIWRFPYGGIPKSSKSLDHCSIETYDDLGILHYKNSIYNALNGAICLYIYRYRYPRSVEDLSFFVAWFWHLLTSWSLGVFWSLEANAREKY